MTKALDTVLKSLPKKRQARVEARAAELVSAEMTLQDLRKAMALTQKHMAKRLKIGQDSISRLEKRSDLHLSTLESYVRAMGGNLSLVAKFPDRSPVTLKGLCFDQTEAAKVKTKRSKKSGSSHAG